MCGKKSESFRLVVNVVRVFLQLGLWHSKTCRAYIYVYLFVIEWAGILLGNKNTVDTFRCFAMQKR